MRPPAASHTEWPAGGGEPRGAGRHRPRAGAEQPIGSIVGLQEGVSKEMALGRTQRRTWYCDGWVVDELRTMWRGSVKVDAWEVRGAGFLDDGRCIRGWLPRYALFPRA